MAQFQVPPSRQMPTQFRRAQTAVKQQQARRFSGNQNISWTIVTYLNSWGPIPPEPGAEDLLYEITPDGNFVFLTGRLIIPSGATSGVAICTIAESECYPVRSECITCSSESGTGAITPVMVRITSAGNVQAYGTLNVGWTLSINGMYPISAVAS